MFKYEDSSIIRMTSKTEILFLTIRSTVCSIRKIDSCHQFTLRDDHYNSSTPRKESVSTRLYFYSIKTTSIHFKDFFPSKRVSISLFSRLSFEILGLSFSTSIFSMKRKFSSRNSASSLATRTLSATRDSSLFLGLYLLIP